MPHSITTASRLALALAGAGVIATACGGSSGGSSGGKAAVAQQPTAASSSTAAVTIVTHKGPLGTYLTDAKGRTLYAFAADKGSTSTCYGSCATYWPPLTTTSMPATSGAANASMVGTTKRTDGSTEVTYAGHPLYYYVGDAAPGDTKGQGLNLSGGLWWVVAPGGAPITSAKPSSPTSSPSSGGGYGGYGY